MLIDWFTVLAQIANFLILMWLLKYFLYQPVLDTIDAREKRITDVLKEAQQSQQQAEQQQAELATKNATFSTEQSDVLEKAEIKAESVKQTMLEAAAQEVAQKRSQWLADLQKEQRNLNHDIAQRTQQEVFQVARKALKDLSGAALETQMIQVLIKRLAQLNQQQRQEFSGGAQDSLIIRSALPLAEEEQTLLQQAVTKTFATQLPVRFEVDEKLVSGIEMLGNGHKLSWNIEDYLSGLENSIGTLVTRKVSTTERQASIQVTEAPTEEAAHVNAQ